MTDKKRIRVYKISDETLIKIVSKAFAEGILWAETYVSWFDPSKEDTEKRKKHALSICKAMATRSNLKRQNDILLKRKHGLRWSMKMITLIIIILLLSSPAMAWDGELYFGRFFNSTLRSAPGGEDQRYAEWIGGVEIGHKMLDDRLRPYLRLETLMDGVNKDNSFSPASIKYDLGIRAEIYGGIYLDLSHMCWHPVDDGGPVEQYGLLIKAGVKF